MPQRGAVEAYVAPEGLSALQDPADRTFAASRFRHCYGNTPAPRGPMTLGSALKDLLRAYCTCESIPWHDGGDDFFEQLQAEANMHDPIDEMMQRMWTSALTLRGHEFCFVLNCAVRGDAPPLAEPTAALSRGINKLCVSVPPRPPFPPGDVCLRGGGFDDRYRSFFVPRRKFRQPAYLATSFSVGTGNSASFEVPLPRSPALPNMKPGSFMRSGSTWPRSMPRPSGSALVLA